MTSKIAAGLFVALIMHALPATAAERQLDRTFAIAGQGTLVVEADGSDISVTGTDGNQVIVAVRMKGSQDALDDMTLTAEQTGNDVRVIARHEASGWKSWWFGGGGVNGRISVQIPTNYRLDVRTSGGNIVAQHVRGDATGKTSGGDIRVDDVHGTVRMKTSGGNVQAAGIEGSTDLETSGGNMEVRTMKGNLSVKTSGGNIRLQDIDGPVTARTSSGAVIAQNIRGTADLHTSGGDVRGEGIDGRVRAHTSGGNVDLAIAGSNRGVDASTSGGDIVVQIARDTRAYLDAATSGGSVRSELPVSVTESGERKLQGTINGGGETIRARTSGGSIRVKVRT